MSTCHPLHCAQAFTMNDPGDFDPALPVREVITRLLLVALPAELRASAADLAECVATHPEIACLVERRWGELSESEGDAVAREVGIVARDMIFGAAGAEASGIRLH